MPVWLREVQRIPTSGARAAETLVVDGLTLVAIPQLAIDLPGPAGMNGGDSDTDLLLLQRRGEHFTLRATIAAPGGEDAEFFTIGDRAFLAVASIRSGSGPYSYSTTSTIHEWNGTEFVPFQAIPTYAAKQFRHWTVGARHFLGLAQGLDLPHVEGANQPSVIFEWRDGRFAEFQTIPSTWAYNWLAFSVGETHFLAHADHLGPSRLYAWDGARYEARQELLARCGRAFAHWSDGDQDYLLVAGLEAAPVLWRWDGSLFRETQTLAGLGARELRVLQQSGRTYVVRVNFIEGTPADPNPLLTSQVYEFSDGELAVVAEFPTSGGTDVGLVTAGEDEAQFIVTNSLSRDVRFATDTVVYAMTSEPGAA
jgi:hypothetical protein